MWANRINESDMQLYWGNYAFPVNQALITTNTRVIRGDNRRPLRYVVTGNVTADLFGNSQSELTAQENLLRVALATPYVDLVLRQDNGQASGTSMINRNSLSGVMVVDGPHFLESTRGQYVNVRTAQFTVEAEYIFPGTQSSILSFTESISIRGTGGPRYNWRFPLNGPAVCQQLSLQSLVTTIQRGAAVGHTVYPSFPPPFAGRPPGIFVEESAVNEQDSPKAIGRGWVEYPIRWSYEYRGVEPLVGSPSLPPLF